MSDSMLDMCGSSFICVNIRIAHIFYRPQVLTTQRLPRSRPTDASGFLAKHTHVCLRVIIFNVNMRCTTYTDTTMHIFTRTYSSTQSNSLDDKEVCFAHAGQVPLERSIRHCSSYMHVHVCVL